MILIYLMRYAFKNINSVCGFTMLEILVVMGIISVIAALTVPKVGNRVTNLKLRSAVRGCSAVLRYSRSIAITTQKQQKVSFKLNEDPEEKDYYKYNKVTLKSSGTEETSDDYESDVVNKKGELQEEEKKVFMDIGSISFRDNPDDVWQEDGTYEIIFTHRGFNTGGELRFALSEDRRGYILKIDPITGKVMISREEE